MNYDNYGVIYKDIEKHRELVKLYKQEIENTQMVIDSLMETIVRKTRGIFIPYSEKMLHEAWCQQNKPKPERKMFDFVKGDLFERLFDKDERKQVKFESITPLNYDHCVYYFYFSYKGIKFNVVIPNVKVANKENIWDMAYGMYRLTYEKSSGYWNTITESYDIDDIARAIQEFVKDKDDYFSLN